MADLNLPPIPRLDSRGLPIPAPVISAVFVTPLPPRATAESSVELQEDGTYVMRLEIPEGEIDPQGPRENRWRAAWRELWRHDIT